jgi:hypothetical protein
LTLPRGIELDPERLDQPLMHRMHEAHGQQHQIGGDFEFGAGYRLNFGVGAGAMQRLDRAILAAEFRRQHGEVARDAFLVARRGAQL